MKNTVLPQNAAKRKARNNRNFSQRTALALIRGYQLTLSPWIGKQCRFYPTCSHYAAQAIEQHGTLSGIGLSARRLAKCHPFHPGGVDLVPENNQTQTLSRTNQI